MADSRPASALLVTALIRRAGEEGGNAAVLAKGDATAGAVLLVLAERGATIGLVERGLDRAGQYRWLPAGPKSLAEPGALGDYIARRRRADPDLWVVELDCPQPQAVAEGLFG